MKKVLLSILLIIGFASVFLAQQYQGAEAAEKVDGATQVWLKSNTKLPSYIQFDGAHHIPAGEFMDYAFNHLGLDAQNDRLVFTRLENDPQGQVHKRYQQLFKGIPVEGSMYILHQSNAHVFAMNGEFFDIANNTNTQASLSEAAALVKALAHIGAIKYKWEIPGADDFLKRFSALNPQLTPQTTYFPEGELVMVAMDGNFQSTDFRLAWKFDIYADKPLSRTHTFVDAVTGNIIWEQNKIHTADAAGTAATRYSGSRTITTDSFFGGFRLREVGRGNGIQTWNMLTGTNYANAVDFTDSDNNWTSTANMDDAATDAHYGAEQVYDFYNARYSRNSIDGAGFTLMSFVHYDNGYVNAFWDGTQMTYGDGNASPLTGIDVCGHEITHGLTSFTADLIYQNESGALNESFSDIFGKAVEKYARPNNFTWEIGHDINLPIRDMQDPGLMNDPKNYLGNNWFVGAGDRGGVHTNSGVQNHWFYLLVEGGTGTNDFGDAYNVTGIGFVKAAAIAYRNLTNYLTPSSQYADAQRFGIQSAIDLYGACSTEHEATANAWHAVGIGPAFSRVAISDFNAQATSTCTAPYTIQFLDQSASPGTWDWSFGDGQTSNIANPRHVYAAPGTYTVVLNITGLCGGTDVTTKTNFVNIQAAPASPVVAAVNPTPCRSRVQLSATASGQVNWYDKVGTFLGTGASFSAPGLTSTDTFYAQHVSPDVPQKIGPLDHTIGVSNALNIGAETFLTFTVNKTLNLKTVWVDAPTAGLRSIEIKDGDGNLVTTKNINVPAGASRITLNVNFEPGDYTIGGKSMNLFRNRSGASYPYNINGVVAITGSSFDNDTYYYFYDWEVETFCGSARILVPVQVVPLGPPTVADITRCSAGPVTFVATSNPGARTTWHNNILNLLGTGQSFTTPSISGISTYRVRQEVGPPARKVGPIDGASTGSGGYHSGAFEGQLRFDVFKFMRLKSVWVDAGSDGMREITIYNADGSVKQIYRKFIAQGASRVDINIDLLPGSYAIGGIKVGGGNADLFRNNAGATFPYNVRGLISIRGNNTVNNPNQYFYYYDWEVQEPLCVTSYKQVRATVIPGSGPTSSFTFSETNRVVTFTNQSTGGSTFLWSFGDGNSSTQRNPTHTYTAPGTYTMVLIVSNGNCEEASAQDLTLQVGVAVDPLLDETTVKLYPNPGQGRFTFNAELPHTAEVQLTVFDALGRTIYTSPRQSSKSVHQIIDLGNAASGTYIVQFSLDGRSLYRKYLLK